MPSHTCVYKVRTLGDRCEAKKQVGWGAAVNTAVHVAPKLYSGRRNLYAVRPHPCWGAKRLQLQRNENQRGSRTVLHSGELAHKRRIWRSVLNWPCWFTAIRNIWLQSKHWNFAVCPYSGGPSFKYCHGAVGVAEICRGYPQFLHANSRMTAQVMLHQFPATSFQNHYRTTSHHSAVWDTYSVAK